MASDDSGLIRVAILSENATADIALPIGIPIRDLIPQVRSIIDTGTDEGTRSSASGHAEDRHEGVTKAEEAAAIRPYSLAPVAKPPFSLDATLATLGVTEGDLLVLCPVPAGPVAPPVVENIADAAKIHSKDQFAAFKYETLQAATTAAFLAILAFVTGFAAFACYLHRTWLSLGVLAGCALVAVLATLLWSRRDRRVSNQLGLAAAIPIGLAVSAIPGEFGPMRIFLVASAVLAWSLVQVVQPNRFVAAHTAIIATAAAIDVVCLARWVWSLPNMTLGCVLLVGALTVAWSAPLLAAMWSRYPLPYVPAPGEAVDPPPSLRELESLPRKVAQSHAHETGLIAATVFMQVIGSVLVLWRPDHPIAGTLIEWRWVDALAWWLVVVVAIVTVLRKRIWDAAAPSWWLLVSPLLTAATLAVSFACNGHQTAAWWAIAAVVALLVALGSLAALRPKSLSIPRIRYLDLFENTLLFTLMPAVVVLTGIVTMILNRRVS